MELYDHFDGSREPYLQRFEVFEDYQAEGWARPRRIVATIEINPQGSQRRFVVTNLSGHPRGIYRGFYVQRGAVPEQPIDELKHGLQADRWSASSFRANGFRLLLHVVASAIVVLFREAATVPEVATATVSTLRQRLWKAGAVLVSSAQRSWLHVSETWPGRSVWAAVHRAVAAFVGQVTEGQRSGSARCAGLPR